ncbi:RNA-binding protein [candidate division KSB1 bacterium]|nr:RNA-binding protein [candidate division KSB1 bacterium]
MNIYIGNLPKSTDEETVRKLFEEHGEVSEIKLIKDQYTNELRGFGFVTMPSQEEAKKAIEEINETELGGRQVIVNEARPKKDRSQGRRGGGGGRGGSNRSRSRSW